MKTLLAIAIVSYSILIAGCSYTEGTLNIEGRVIDEHTNVGLSNRVVLIQGLVESDSTLIPTADIGRFYTDSFGHFSYTLKKIKGVYSYNFIFVGDSTYSYTKHELRLYELEKRSKYLSFKINKLTNLIIKIERSSKTIPYDTLFVSWKTDGKNGKTYPYKVINQGTAPDIEFRWIGGDVKSQIETRTLANKTTVINIDLFRKGRIKEISDTIYCDRDVDNYFTFKY